MRCEWIFYEDVRTFATVVATVRNSDIRWLVWKVNAQDQDIASVACRIMADDFCCAGTRHQRPGRVLTWKRGVVRILVTGR